MKDDVEKILLKRYIEAEKTEPDFIERGLSSKFTRQVFVFVYYAGHGCMQKRQYFVLNEDNVEKSFWPAEEKLRLIG